MVRTWGGMGGMPWSETHGECGGGAGGSRELLALAALGHKVGDKAGDGVAASLAPFGWDGRVVALLGTAPVVSKVATSWVGLCIGVA